MLDALLRSLKAYSDLPNGPSSSYASEVGNPQSISDLTTQVDSLHLDGPSVPALTAHLASLELEDDQLGIPGAFSNCKPTGSSLDEMETLLTAATLTATPIHSQTHNRLFSSSSEFYERATSYLPDSLAPLDLSDASEALLASTVPTFSPSVTQTTKTPAFRPSRSFGRSPAPSHKLNRSHSRSTSPTPASPSEPRMGKVDRDAMESLQCMHEKLAEHRNLVFCDDFSSLIPHIRRSRVDCVLAFANDSLSRVQQIHLNAKRRKAETHNQKRSQTCDTAFRVEKECDALRELLRSLSVSVRALEALLPQSDCPVKVDADHLFNTDLCKMDQINQVLILLAVIFNMVVGLSISQTNFLIGIATMLVKLGMSTIRSTGSHLDAPFTPSQSSILADMPASLNDAFKKFNVEGSFHLFATCPSCSFTTKGQPLAQSDAFDFPETCKNRVVGEDGIFECGAQLLKTRADGAKYPIKPYIVNSFSDYVARCLADPIYLEQSLAATDATLESIKQGKGQSHVYDVFDAEFTRNFKGPDRNLFIDRGDKIRLGFSIHVDFFNPNGITHRGAHESIGIISCANLALDPSIRYLPEYLFVAGIIPGPQEPSYETLDYFVRPVIEQFISSWRPGIHVSRTADPDSTKSGAVVEAGILLSVNDLPAARKVAGLQGVMHERICSVCQLRGRSQVYNTDHSQWIRKDVDYLRHWAKAWRDATTVKERKQIFDDHGVHWSSFWLLEYWDPTRMLVVDAMHTILEGLVHFHCRHVLRLDATALEVSTDGIKVAYDWPWTEYDDDLAPADCKVEEDRIPSVTKIQNALLLAIAGDHCLTLDQLWTRVENAGYRESLCYVVHSLGLPMDKASLDGMSPVIKELYDNRAKQRLEKSEKLKAKKLVSNPSPDSGAKQKKPQAKKKSKTSAEGLQGTVFPDSGAKYKHHFIALLLNWRLKQPQRWGTSLTKTGTPETLAHIQHVIQTVVTPAWLHSVPKNYGELKAGSIKADEWRILSSVQLPIALITLWGDDDGCVPPSDDTEAGLLFRALDHTMALFQATIICCRNTTSSSRAAAFRKYLAIWVKDLRSIYPHISQGIPRTNVHAAGHLFDFLLAFGPVISWWCFPFERLIGTVQKINTSDHIGGIMESTMMKTLARTANIRHWLRRPDCPEAVKQLKRLFDKCFVPVNAPTEPQLPREVKGPERAHVSHLGVNYSRSRTHEGNATIFYRPTPDSTPPPIAGQIQSIENVRVGANTMIKLHVVPYKPLSKALYDPFVRYPHLDAKTYSSELASTEHVIGLDGIVSHAARFDFSRGRSVFLNLSRE